MIQASFQVKSIAKLMVEHTSEIMTESKMANITTKSDSTSKIEGTMPSESSKQSEITKQAKNIRQAKSTMQSENTMQSKCMTKAKIGSQASTNKEESLLCQGKVADVEQAKVAESQVAVKSLVKVSGKLSKQTSGKSSGKSSVKSAVKTSGVPLNKKSLAKTAKSDAIKSTKGDSSLETLTEGATTIGVTTKVATTEGSTLLSAQEREELMHQLQLANPNPKSELDFTNPFELLCAVIMSAQATDVSVNLVTPQLFALAPDAHALAQMTEEQVGQIIKTVGLWKNKAKNLIAMAKLLVAKYDGQVPQSYEQLIELPGVGSKTAKVVLNVAFGQPYIAVDTHVFRVCNRTGLCCGSSVSVVEKALPAFIPEPYLKEAHHYLLLHGRYVCKAKSYQTNCPTCVAKDYCREYQKSL